MKQLYAFFTHHAYLAFVLFALVVVSIPITLHLISSPQTIQQEAAPRNSPAPTMQTRNNKISLSQNICSNRLSANTVSTYCMKNDSSYSCLRDQNNWSCSIAGFTFQSGAQLNSLGEQTQCGGKGAPCFFCQPGFPDPGGGYTTAGCYGCTIDYGSCNVEYCLPNDPACRAPSPTPSPTTAVTPPCTDECSPNGPFVCISQTTYTTCFKDGTHACWKRGTSPCPIGTTCTALGNTIACQGAITPTLPPSFSPTPQPSLTITPTTNPTTASVSLSILLPGIGERTGDNRTPQRRDREVSVTLTNAQNQEVKTVSGTLAFANTKYSGTVSLGTVAAGSYSAKVRLDNTLKKRVAILSITIGQTTHISDLALVSGDIDVNNVLDLLDYNSIISCARNPSCSQKTLTDLNDDGMVEEKDINIFLRGLAIREGD